MKKYFICSDIHSFYKPWMKAIKKAGFDFNNQNHILVVNGDLFDRGKQTIECFEFVKDMISKKRLIYIIGNHEYLLMDCLKKSFPDSYDFSNGTAQTICHFANVNYNKFRNWGKTNHDTLIGQWTAICNAANRSGVVEFIKKNTINFMEIKNYIITHAFIPLRFRGDKEASNANKRFWTKEAFEFNKNWRKNATKDEWIAATWGDPSQRYTEWDLTLDKEEKDKYLVVGHEGSFLIRKYYKGGIFKHFGIFQHDHLIAIDATTVISKKINCFVIED